MNRTTQLVSVFTAAFSASAVAQQDPTAAEQAAVFAGPRAMKQPELQYPRSAQRGRKEGWVELNFMVSPDGNAYEIVVADNIGDASFIDSAIEHLEGTTFSPATTGDTAIDGSSRLFYTFLIEGADDGGHLSFIRRYQSFSTALQEGSEEEIELALRRLEDADVSNMYENAFLSLAKYFYAERFESAVDQMVHLRRAVAARSDEDPTSFLGAPAAGARRVLVQLEARNGYYAEAEKTIDLIRRAGDVEGVRLLRGISDQIESLRTGDQEISISGEVDSTGDWEITLLKNRFALRDVSGSVAEIKLRCERSFLVFEFIAETFYDATNSVGACRLQVIGDPGSTFTLAQQ